MSWMIWLNISYNGLGVFTVCLVLILVFNNVLSISQFHPFYLDCILQCLIFLTAIMYLNKFFIILLVIMFKCTSSAQCWDHMITFYNLNWSGSFTEVKNKSIHTVCFYTSMKLFLFFSVTINNSGTQYFILLICS